MTARLSFVALAVRDPDASALFYGGVLGLPLQDGAGEPPFGWLGGRYLVAEPDGVVLALFPTVEAETTARATLAFEVPDVDIVHTRALAAGVSVFGPPRGRRAMYHDPDGHVVVVTEYR